MDQDYDEMANRADKTGTGEMRTLRFSYCDRAGHIVKTINRPCEDEADAKAFARITVGLQAANVETVEVWDGPKLLCRVSRRGRMVPG